jgi:hypothetical protein
MGSLAQASTRMYQGVPATLDDEKQHRYLMAVALNNVLRGKVLSTGSKTLTANAATTTLSDPNIGANSVILLMPKTANAAGALATTYFTALDTGTCTINHTNDAQTDKTFNYVVLG